MKVLKAITHFLKLKFLYLLNCPHETQPIDAVFFMPIWISPCTPSPLRLHFLRLSHSLLLRFWLQTPEESLVFVPTHTPTPNCYHSYLSKMELVSLFNVFLSTFLFDFSSPCQLHQAANHYVNTPCSFTITAFYAICSAQNFIFIHPNLTKSYQSMKFSPYSTCCHSSSKVFAQRIISIHWFSLICQMAHFYFQEKQKFTSQGRFHRLNVEFHVHSTMYSLTSWILNYLNCTVL